MSDPVFRIDERAILKGGDVAGQYLDDIGKTDLAKLTPEEWTTFCTRLVGAAVLFSVGQVYGDKVPF